MKRFRWQFGLAAALALLLGGVGQSRATLIESTFDTDTDGWQVWTIVQGPWNPPPVALQLNPSLYPTWISTGGNPGGYINQPYDPDANTTVFVAPSKFLGNQASFQNGTLSFSLRDQFNDGVPYLAAILVGSDRTLISVPMGPPGTTTWSDFSLSLSPSNWYVNSPSGPGATSGDMTAVLSNLQELYIDADWHSGPDSTDLDTVRLQSTVAAIPEPSTLTVAGFSVFLGLACAWRRGKAKSAA